MNFELFWVVGLFVIIVVFFIYNCLCLDVIVLLVIMVFSVSGIFIFNEVLVGFSDFSVILIVVLFVIGEGLVCIGVVYQVGDWLIVCVGSSEVCLLVLLMLVVVGLGLVMSFIGVVVIFILVVLSIVVKLKIFLGWLMMLLVFVGLISGMMILVVMLLNMVVNSELVCEGYVGFGFFVFILIGFMVFVIGVVYMLFMCNWLNVVSLVEVGVLKVWWILCDLICDYCLVGCEWCLQVQFGLLLIGSILEEL